MSRIFGDLLQIGYVVEDIEATMAHWASRLGVGPWFYMKHLSVPDFTYRGQPSPVRLSLALANSGSMQIELIQQRNEAPSMYLDFRALSSTPTPHDAWCDDHQGVQHLGYGSMDFDADMRRYAALGYTIVQCGTGGSRGPFAYLDTEAHTGTVVEIMDLAHGREALFAGIAAAARGWDGAEPIRTRLPV